MGSLTETWLPVVGFEGAYEVSDLGRVRSLDRAFTDSIGRARFCRGKVLAGSSAAGRYKMYILYEGSVGDPRYLHDLVAEAFIGPKPPGALTRHRDDDPLNNLPSNLTYGTPTDNSQDAVLNGGQKFGEDHHCCIYSATLIADVIASRRQIDSIRAEAKFGISARYIREIWAGEKRVRG